MRGLSGNKHMSDAYDDDEFLRLQQDDSTVAALLLDDVVLGGGCSGRNLVSLRTNSDGGINYVVFLFGHRNFCQLGQGPGLTVAEKTRRLPRLGDIGPRPAVVPVIWEVRCEKQPLVRLLQSSTTMGSDEARPRQP